MKKALIIILIFNIHFVFSQKKLIEKKTKSFLKIPYNSFDYNDFFGKISDSVHTSIKPLHYFEINSKISLNQYEELKINKKTWLGKKLFDEHLFAITGSDYWISIDPVIDFRVGKENLSNKNLFQNTRGIRVEGSLGKQFSFSSTLTENWSRFPSYFDRYIWLRRPHIVPGFGLNKSYDKLNADYPYAEGYISYKPSKFFFFELGHDKHFIGEGAHSLFLSDNAGMYPYFKIEALFWKVKYTTIWTSYQDMREDVTVNGVYKKKFSAIHYIDWNVTKKINLGFFESVIWYNENKRGFDVNYLNPVIFFKTIELETGSGSSNSILGLSVQYKLPYQLQFYGQFILDEMTIDKFFGNQGYWGNKFGYQIGCKYYNAFQIPHLFIRIEYNTIRPYTYGHNTVIANYSHNFQSLAHPWGANFKEILFETQYRYKRWYIFNTLIFGKKGFDFPNNSTSYGGDIFHYTSNKKEKEMNVETLQGNLSEILFNKAEIGYQLNPASHLKIFTGFILRKTNINKETKIIKNETNKFIYFGIKTNLWNDHFNIF